MTDNSTHDSHEGAVDSGDGTQGQVTVDPNFEAFWVWVVFAIPYLALGYKDGFLHSIKDGQAFGLVGGIAIAAWAEHFIEARRKSGRWKMDGGASFIAFCLVGTCMFYYFNHPNATWTRWIPFVSCAFFLSGVRFFTSGDSADYGAHGFDRIKMKLDEARTAPARMREWRP